LICVVVVFVRLHRSIKVEVTARVAASRMVYYLALAAISNVCAPHPTAAASPDAHASLGVLNPILLCSGVHGPARPNVKCSYAGHGCLGRGKRVWVDDWGPLSVSQVEHSFDHWSERQGWRV
jgi:hypothetical protein